MVLYVNKYDILPDKAEGYSTWAGSAIPRLLAAPGVVEFRGYRPSTGSYQVVVTYEFEDLAAWASWADNDDVRQLFERDMPGVQDMEEVEVGLVSDVKHVDDEFVIVDKR